MKTEYPAIFVTGTDTGVGKTVVTAALIALLRSRGVDAVPMKAVQTGCIVRRTGERTSPDLDLILKLNDLRPDAADRALMCPYCFTYPASPKLAAAREKTTVSVQAILRSHTQLRKRHEMVIVEGAGGVLVPLNRSNVIADLIKALTARVIIVARPSLGTLNHTLLTLEAVMRRNLTVEGIVISKNDGKALNALERDNVRTIKQLTRGLPVFYLPFLPGLNRPRPFTPAQFADRVKSIAPLVSSYRP